MSGNAEATAGDRQALCLVINFGWSRVEIRRITHSFACSVAQA
jgi:hypothetical protein